MYNRLIYSHFEIRLNLKIVVDGLDLGIGIASGDIVFSNDTQRYTTEISYTKVKQIICYKNLKGLRVSWEFMAGVGGGEVASRLYVDDVAVGIEHTTESEVMVGVSDDISDVKTNGLIQIYAKKNGVANVYVENMRIKFTEFINNDP